MKRHFAKPLSHNGIGYLKYTESTEDTTSADVLIVGGYVEVPSVPPSMVHRFVNGEWSLSLNTLRHFYNPATGSFSHSSELPPDDVPAGLSEAATRPNGSAFVTENGGATWKKEGAALKAEVSAKRYVVEVAGINFTYRTAQVPVSTSRESRASMIGLYTAAKEGRWVTAPATEANFKFGDGKFRPATTQEVIDMYVAIEAHVKECYRVEGVKIAEIDATGTTDLNTGWPATAEATTTQYFQG